jgi:hypothetical protein
MKNSPVNEPIPDDRGRDRDAEEEQPGVIASVGSSAVGNVDVEPEDEPRPDNDGETVGE